ncbi:MAG: hypothetical protein AAF431_11275 [Pseudomonadota bacterium]
MQLKVLTTILLIASTTLAGCATQPEYSERSFSDFQHLSQRSCESLTEELVGLVKDFEVSKGDTNRVGAGMSTSAVGSILSGAAYSVTLPVALAGGLIGLGYQSLYKERNQAERDHIDGLLAAYNGKGCGESATTQRAVSADVLVKHAAAGQAETQAKETETLPFPDRCTNAVDNIRRSYQIILSGLRPDERLRFFARGPEGGSRDIVATSLLLGELKLPPMSITARRGGKKRGLWVERLVTGERLQLNYLPVAWHCSTKGMLTVKYENTWVRVVPAYMD